MKVFGRTEFRPYECVFTVCTIWSTCRELQAELGMRTGFGSPQTPLNPLGFSE